MPDYRNKQTGRVYSRPVEDKWLEASAGWECVMSEEEFLASLDDPADPEGEKE